MPPGYVVISGGNAMFRPIASYYMQHRHITAHISIHNDEKSKKCNNKNLIY